MCEVDSRCFTKQVRFGDGIRGMDNWIKIIALIMNS